MQVTVWSDYVCPWCYLGRDRTALLESMGASVTPMPFELHPELPPGGREIRHGGRYQARLEDIGRQCEAVGLEFNPPAHIPNSRRALETAEVIRATSPESFGAVDDLLFRAYFVEGRDINDADVIDEVVARAGMPPAAVRAAVERGDGTESVDASKRLALDHGVTGTPAWLFDGGFVLPGVQPRELFERVVSRLGAVR